MNEPQNKFLALINSRLFTTLLLLIGIPFSLALTSSIWVPLVLSGFTRPLVELSQAKEKGPVQQIVSGIATQIVDGIKEPFAQLNSGQNDENLKNFDVAQKLEIRNAKTIASAFPGQEKVIGTLYNDSDQTIRDIHVTASFYDAGGNLLDVDSEWLSNLNFVGAGKSADFEFDWQLKSDNDSTNTDETNTTTSPQPAPKPAKPAKAEASLKVVISSFEVLKK